MRKRIAALSLLVSLSGHAYANVGAIAASASVDALVQNITNSLSQLISEAETSATVAGFGFATDANILIQNIEVMGKELSGKVFSDLNASQQSVISNALVLIDQAGRETERQLDSAETLVANLGQEIARLPLTDGRPMVSRYSPSYVLNNTETYDISLQGSLLNRADTTLYFGATPCEQISSVETELRFSCPAAAFDNDVNGWTTGLLSFDKPRPWYAPWKSPEAYRYKIALMVVQGEIGHYTIRSSESVVVETRIQRKHSNERRNSHCSGGRDVAWTYRPAAGCRVDETSVKVKHRTAENSRYDGITNLSSSGFQTRGRVENGGRCGPGGYPRDARGKLSITAEWVDVCPSSKEAERETEVGTLSWGEDKAFHLPPSVSKWVLEVTQKDGAIKVFDKASPSDWFVVDFDPNTKIVLVKPRQLADAFR